MRYLVLGGCGSIGSVVVDDLARTAKFEKLTIADVDAARVQGSVAAHKRKDIHGAVVKGSSLDEMRSLYGDHDIVVNCTPGHDNVALIEAAIAARKPYVDIVGSMLAEERLALNERAADAGVLAVIALGCSPGLTNVAAAHGISQLDRTREVIIEYASLRPFNPSPGLLDTAIRQYNKASRCPVFENGKLRYEPPFSGGRMVRFPDPVGEQQVFFAQHSEVLTLSSVVPGIETVKVYGTYHPAIVSALRVFKDHGLIETDPIEFDGKMISPRAFITKVLSSEKIPFPGPTHFAMRINVSGFKDGAQTTHSYTMTHDPEGPRKGQLPQIWTTAVGASVGAQMIAAGTTNKVGVLAPESCIDPMTFMRGAAERDILIDWETRSQRNIDARGVSVVG